ncbi:hypothetical protein AOC36_04990 [Erysipelothrix larvae]|uniref:Uncharacterized protein n=2 Tax=Erysipelothrix larvae TaxID=1514105 RepID=A0A120JU21_9FIRM|nr:hypothetical protein AOC36_04990 [Erysipelothrix larvae]
MVSSQLIEDSFTDFQYCQLEAMAEKTRCTVNENLWFNKNGNINQAQTQQFGRKTCVFQLGFGRFKCER